ncbi:FecR domain-containing protein [Hymenobacter sp. ISL-91]|uniref:FecR family protein n=1 Tax=Hymenobacter sp. ISL-91 TaxID=2819151 RepID=UPI001BE9E86C|nr:FecR family protein [Hymenobacter sp. ISL-91]MBT2556699.1 FecR domain-containing protein [Hymenobacter sp. ISL-91]
MKPTQQALDAAQLLGRYLRGELTAAEAQAFGQWLAADPRNAALLDSLQDAEALRDELAFFARLDPGAAWQHVAQQTSQPTVRPLLPPPNAPEEADDLPTTDENAPAWWQRTAWRVAAAAALLLGLGTATYEITHRPTASTVAVAPVPAAPATSAPASARAQLKLANGKVLNLHELRNGSVWTGGGIRVSQQDGVVQYEVVGKVPAGSAVAYHTLAAPRGSRYQLVLPDGSRVWLNAASSLRFPTAFVGSQRRVELTGQAYFEVAPNKRQPFRVQAGGTTVQVLGTHFDVMAYPDEPGVRTTLLEGSVNIERRGRTARLRPGQQAVCALGSSDIVIGAADMEAAVAWKQDLFSFRGHSLPEVMRQLSRWYNVDVQYASQLPESHYSGLISRRSTLPKVLEMLTLTGDVRFEQSGRTVRVEPKK